MRKTNFESIQTCHQRSVILFMAKKAQQQPHLRPSLHQSSLQQFLHYKAIHLLTTAQSPWEGMKQTSFKRMVRVPQSFFQVALSTDVPLRLTLTINNTTISIVLY